MNGKPILDFYIENTFDPEQFILVDISQWKHIKEKPAVVEIVTPGRKSPIIHYIEKNQINNFTSLDLGLNCISGCDGLELIDLPDGIYDITLKGSPENLFSKNRKYFRSTNLRLRIDLFYLDLVSHSNKNIIDTLRTIELYLDSAESNTRYENVKKAKYLYEKALKLTEKLENCENCKDVSTEYIHQNHKEFSGH